MGDRELTCREMVELVSDHLEGALTLAERALFERHLADCPHCVAYLEQIRATIRAMRGLRAPSRSI